MKNRELVRLICLAYKDFVQSEGTLLSADLWLGILGEGYDADAIWEFFELGLTAAGCCQVYGIERRRI